MKVKPKEVLSTIKQASPFDVLLLIFLLIPAVLGGWLVVLDRINLDDQTETLVLATVAGLFVIFSLIAYSRTWWAWKKLRRLTKARDTIARYMDKQNRQTMSVKAVNSNCEGVQADENLFYALLSMFPNDFELAWSKSRIMLLSRVVTAKEVEDPPEG